MTDELVKKALIEGAIPEGYEELHAEFFKFEHTGDFVCGKYISKTQQKAGTSIANKYTFLNSNNILVSFLGTSNLDDLLKQASYGKYIIVEFNHTEPPKVEGNNPLKFFRVMIKSSDIKSEKII